MTHLCMSGQVSEGSVGDGSEAVPVKQTEKKNSNGEKQTMPHGAL